MGSEVKSNKHKMHLSVVSLFGVADVALAAVVYSLAACVGIVLCIDASSSSSWP